MSHLSIHTVCSSNCDNCTSYNTCSRCRSGYYKYRGSCVLQCPMGFANQSAMECQGMGIDPYMCYSQCSLNSLPITSLYLCHHCMHTSSLVELDFFAHTKPIVLPYLQAIATTISFHNTHQHSLFRAAFFAMSEPSNCVHMIAYITLTLLYSFGSFCSILVFAFKFYLRISLSMCSHRIHFHVFRLTLPSHIAPFQIVGQNVPLVLRTSIFAPVVNSASFSLARNA